MKHYLLNLVFLLTFTFTSAQSRFNQDKQIIGIYPNPATTSFTIKFENPTKVINVSIFSIIGNEVLNRKIDSSSNKLNFNIQNLKKGKYIVRILNNDGSTETQSLIKL